MLGFLLIVAFFLFEHCHSATILVYGVSPWPHPSVHIGDTVIFKDKYEEYKLYIFKDQMAFSLCNFTQATLLTNSNSNSFTWYPSRPGLYYFTFSNTSFKSCNSQFSQKLSIKVTLPPPPPVAPPVPAPVSGGEVASSPASYPWPFRPRESASSPAPAPSNGGGGGGAKSPMTMPTVDNSESGKMPFINSNPAVPLPTDEVDSATIRPFSASNARRLQVAPVGYFGAHMIFFCVILLLLM